MSGGSDIFIYPFAGAAYRGFGQRDLSVQQVHGRLFGGGEDAEVGARQVFADAPQLSLIHI